MNKVKTFFVATALLLTTVGVFAGKARFSSIGLEVDTTGSGGYVQVNTTSGVPAGFQITTNGTQVQVSDHNGNAYNLFYFDGTTHNPVYQTGTTW